VLAEHAARSGGDDAGRPRRLADVDQRRALIDSGALGARFEP